MRKRLHTSEAQLKATEAQLKGGREDHDAEMDAFMNVSAIRTSGRRLY